MLATYLMQVHTEGHNVATPSRNSVCHTVSRPLGFRNLLIDKAVALQSPPIMTFIHHQRDRCVHFTGTEVTDAQLTSWLALQVRHMGLCLIIHLSGILLG